MVRKLIFPAQDFPMSDPAMSVMVEQVAVSFREPADQYVSVGLLP